MNKIFLSIMIILLTIATYAKNDENKVEASTTIENVAPIKLIGIVIDKNSNEALVGVEVKLEGTNQKTYTDFDGKFSFSNLKPGEYNLETSYISYKKNIIQKLGVKDITNMVSIKLETAK